MWCCIKLVIVLTVCVPLVYSDAVVIAITKSEDAYCEQRYTFKCNVSGTACCTGTSTRVWRKDNVQIMSNGAELQTSGKYSESVSDAENYFTLTINNINDEDFYKDFVCSYEFFTSNATKLSKDEFHCNPCWECVETGGPYVAYGYLIATFLQFLACLFGFCCFKSFFYMKQCCCHKSDAALESGYIRLYGKDYKRGKIWKPLGIAIIVTFTVCVVYAIIFLLPIGTFCTACYKREETWFVAIGIGVFIFTFMYYWTLKCSHDKTKIKNEGRISVDPEHAEDDDTFPNWQYGLYLVLTALIVPIPFLVLYEKYHKGGKNSSTESGSPEKERADKKKDRKPTEVVRPQPSRPLPPMHLKTDNSGRVEYSTETEIYKPRPLPSISLASDSPRPLPNRTTDDQLEKGGIQLKPLGDSTSEKKKRKKKETKQSDEDN